MLKIITTIICFGALFMIVGCAWQEARVPDSVIGQEQHRDVRPSYFKINTTESTMSVDPINFVGRIKLIDALRQFFPRYHIKAMDTGVILEDEISISALNMPPKLFLNTLAFKSDLEMTVKSDRIEIRSFITNEWLLGALAGGKQLRLESSAALSTALDAEDNAATVTETLSYDEWSSIVESAKAMLQVDQNPLGLSPYVIGVRSIGKIVAGGPVSRMRQLDDYLTGLEQSSTAQVAIEVKAFDVTLSESQGTGINWSELTSIGGSFNGNPLDLSITNSSGGGVPNALTNEGLWRAQIGFLSDSVSGNAVLQFLKRFGEVELLNQPHLTVRNGGFAVMHAGDQLSYIAETEVVQSSEDETVAVAAEVKQIKVGVSLAVSPRVLDDRRILLNIWPVVSSVQGFDEFYSDPIPVRVPRLALQELSTEVIVESGKTIPIGGLIRKSVQDSLQTLPFSNRLTGALLKPFFHSESTATERRELVLLVTPRLVTDGSE